jgi:hypothetical protein
MRHSLVAVLALGLALSSGLHALQRLAMMRAEWSDLETWSRYDESARENELGLGLIVPGPAGPTMLAFTGRLTLRTPVVAPREVGVQAAIGKFTNPNLVRRPTLLFTADAGTDELFTLDVSDRLNVDDPTPGGAVENATAILRVQDFIRLTGSKTLSAEVFGFESRFRPDQIEALRQFGARLRILK